MKLIHKPSNAHILVHLAEETGHRLTVRPLIVIGPWALTLMRREKS